MIDIRIGLDGVPSERKITLGNKYENNDEIIHFNLPETFDSYNKYVIAVMRVNGINVTKVIPVFDALMYVSTELTYQQGNWYMYLMCKEHPVDLDVPDIDISAKDGEHVFISDGFIGIVNESKIDKNVIDNTPMDTNIKIIYEDLLKLKDQLWEIVVGRIKWDQITDKPETFPPAPHDHNDLYYTKTETDIKIPEVAAQSVIPKIKDEVIPEVVPEIVSTVVPDVVNEVVPEVVNDVVPDIVTEVVPQIAVTQDDNITNEEIEALFREIGWRIL